MPTLTSVNAQWTNALAVSDADSRRINAGTFAGDGSALGARGGIVYHGPSSLAVTVNGSDQITVQAGVVAIPSTVALAGVYMAAFGSITGPGAGTAITTRNSTNPRIDLVVADTSAGVARIRTVDGTPSSSPVAPALPAGSVELARLTVPALGGGAVTVDSTWRTYASALGGTLYAPSLSRFPGSGNLPGQRAVALDTGYSYSWNGSAWGLREGVWQTYNPVWTATSSNPSVNNGSLTGRFMALGDKTLQFYIALFLGTTTNLGSGRWEFSLPVTPIGYGDGITAFGRAIARDVGSRNYGCDVMFTAPNRVHAWRDAGATEATVTPTTPFTWAAGDALVMLGTCEAL